MMNASFDVIVTVVLDAAIAFLTGTIADEIAGSSQSVDGVC
jgi:hypothetical protein